MNATEWLVSKLKEAKQRPPNTDNLLQKTLIQQTNLQIQMHQTQRELAELCEKFNRLTQQLAEEGRNKNNSEHRRLEVDED